MQQWDYINFCRLNVKCNSRFLSGEAAILNTLANPFLSNVSCMQSSWYPHVKNLLSFHSTLLFTVLSALC